MATVRPRFVPTPYQDAAEAGRLILRDGYETWLSRIPDFSVAEGFEPDYETGNTRHMLALPLCFPVGVAPN